MCTKVFSFFDGIVGMVQIYFEGKTQIKVPDTSILTPLVVKLLPLGYIWSRWWELVCPANMGKQRSRSIRDDAKYFCISKRTINELRDSIWIIRRATRGTLTTAKTNTSPQISTICILWWDSIFTRNACVSDQILETDSVVKVIKGIAWLNNDNTVTRHNLFNVGASSPKQKKLCGISYLVAFARTTFSYWSSVVW